MNKLIVASGIPKIKKGNKIEGHWAKIMAKTLSNRNIDDLLL